jgi:protein-S-isoprenylcysteine O-methyltransferase Ste14
LFITIYVIVGMYDKRWAKSMPVPTAEYNSRQFYILYAWMVVAIFGYHGSYAFAALSFGNAFFQVRLSDGVPSFNQFGLPLGVFIFLAGLYFVVRGRIELNGYWSSKIVVHEPKHWITDGIYGWIRHPIYFGQMLMVLATAVMTDLLWIFLAGLLFDILIVIRTLREERSIKQSYRAEYDKYSLHTSRFGIF